MQDDYTRDTWSVPVEDMQRKERENFLKALAGRVRARGAQKLLKIIHARVPIIKFEDHITGVEVDVAIDSIGAQFKSVAVGIIASIDWRVGALVRLIKLWARRHNLNDSSTGTFNSYALTLLIIFHCQTRSPAILPPLAELFGGSSSRNTSTSRNGGEDDDNPEERPMHDHRRPDLTRLRDMQHKVTRFKAEAQRLHRSGEKVKNQETLLELLSSFFSLFQGLMRSWNGPDEALSRVLCRVRVNTWDGCVNYCPWTDKRDGAYHCSIEDPFDSTDNVGRTIREDGTIGRILVCVDQAVHICAGTLTLDKFEHGLEELFGAEVLGAAYLNDQKLLERGKLQNATEAVLPTALWVPESLEEYVLGTQSIVEPETNGHRGLKSSNGSSLGGDDGGGGDGGSQSCPDIFSPGAVLEFPKLTLNGESPFLSSSTMDDGTSEAAGTAGVEPSSPMDDDNNDKVESDLENDLESLFDKFPGSLYWDRLHVLLHQTTAALAVEAAEEAVKEAGKKAQRAARKEAKQLKDKKRRELKKSENDGGGEKKTAVVEEAKNKEGRAAAAAAAAAATLAREKPQGEGQKPNRRERRRNGGGRGKNINGAPGGGDGSSGPTTNDANGGKQNGGGNRRKQQPRPAVVVVPRPSPPPGL